MNIFTSHTGMRDRFTLALAAAFAIAMSLASATAQEKPAPAPEQQAAAAAAAGPQQPPCKAVALSQQEEILRLGDVIAQLQRQIVQLQRGLLDQAKRNAEPEIVKEAGGKPGQSWDFERNELRAAPSPPAAPAKP
jgi:hypothetical protein